MEKRLKSDDESTIQTASIEYQAKCAEQAKREFDAMGYKPQNIAGYENHYNAKLNKCFMLIGSTNADNPNMVWIFRTLSDAFEGKTYGTYVWHAEKDKKYWEVPPFHCDVLLNNGNGQLCNSEEEVDRRVKANMEE